MAATRDCFLPHILWLVPCGCEETKATQENDFESHMFSSMLLCDDGASVEVCTNWTPNAKQPRETNEETKRRRCVIPLDYDNLAEQAQQLVEASFHLSKPTLIIFDLRTGQSHPHLDEEKSRKMLLYMINIIQGWRTLYKQSIFSVLVGSNKASALSRWSALLRLVQLVDGEHFTTFLHSLENNVYLWTGELFLRSSSTRLGTCIVSVATEQHSSNEIRSLWLFFRQLEPIAEIEQLETDAHWWHTLPLPCEFRMIKDEPRNSHYRDTSAKMDTFAAEWYRITFRTPKGVSKSCLLWKQDNTFVFQMHSMIPLTFPGYFGFAFATVAKQLHAMALSVLTKDNTCENRNTFATIWKKHIQRMDGMADIKVFFPPLNTLETPQLFHTQGQDMDASRKSDKENGQASSMPNKNGVVKRRKRALRKLALRTTPRQQCAESPLSSIPHQDQQLIESKNGSRSPASSSIPDDRHLDNNFVAMYNKVIEYWFSLLGQHFPLDSKPDELLQYSFMSSACEEIYQVLARAYHQLLDSGTATKF